MFCSLKLHIKFHLFLLRVSASEWFSFCSVSLFSYPPGTLISSTLISFFLFLIGFCVKFFFFLITLENSKTKIFLINVLLNHFSTIELTFLGSQLQDWLLDRGHLHCHWIKLLWNFHQ